MAEKTTQKEMYERIAEFMNDDPEVVEFCERKIKQIITRKRKPKENKEAEEFRTKVTAWLSEHEGAYTNAELKDALEVSPQKMAAALRRLVADEAVIRIEPTEKGAKPSFALA